MDAWQMKLVVMVHAEDADNLALLLREIAKRVKSGEVQGNANHCAGVYSFTAADSEGKPFASDMSEGVTSSPVDDITDGYPN